MLKSRILLVHCLYYLIPLALTATPVLPVDTFTIHVLDLRVEKHYSSFGVYLLIGPLHSPAYGMIAQFLTFWAVTHLIFYCLFAIFQFELQFFAI
jgi:hypothetical protein